MIEKLNRLENFQKQIVGVFIWIIPFILSFFLQFSGNLDDFEETIVDVYYNFFNPGHQFSNDVVIVAIDNDSLKKFSQHPEFGRWPWNRNVYHPVLNFISKQNPKIIFFDILFTEPSKNDSSLVESNRSIQNVSHTLFLHRDGRTEEKLDKYKFILNKFKFRVEEFSDCDNVYSEIVPPANNIGKSSNLLHALGDRRIGDRMEKEDLLLYKFHQYHFLSLPLVAFHYLHPIQKIIMKPYEMSIFTNANKLNIPLNECFYNYHYYNKSEIKNFPIVPYSKFLFLFGLDNEIDNSILKIFRDKIVLIGATATSIYDEKVTPYGNLPSVYLNAMAISNILEKHFLTRLPLSIGLSIGIFFTILAIFFMFFFKGSFYRVFLPFVFLVLYIALSIVFFQFDNSLNLSFFLIFYPLSYVASLGYISFIEGKENERLAHKTMDLNKQLVTFNEKLEDKIKERTNQLEDAHKQIVKLEKLALEKALAGGFAHEIRNALAGPKIVVEKALRSNLFGRGSICEQNSNMLMEIYKQIDSKIEKDTLSQVFLLINKINNNEKDLEQTLKLIKESTEKGLKITNQILEYSRIGEIPKGNDIINIKEIVQKIVNSHKNEFLKLGISIVIELENVEIQGIESYFYSIINNLVLNAKDALLEIPSNKQIKVVCSIDGEFCRIEVIDNGVGIPEKNLNKIFKPFFSTKPSKGIGLGLSYIDKIITIYEGTIDVVSRPRVETKFSVKLPLKRDG